MSRPAAAAAIRFGVVFGALAALAVLAPACKLAGKHRGHTAIGPDAEALRAAFNADAGKVRVIALVAPT